MRDPLERLTADGMIRTGVARANVPTPFEPILQDVIREFDMAREPGSELHLYGSVATGMARVAESDVDLLTINGAPDWAHELGDHLSRRYAAICRSVEIGVAQTSDFIGTGDEAYGNRVFLRHYCVSLAGPDAFRPIAPFAGDARAARGFNGDLARHLARWRRSGADGRRVARKALLAAAGVISVRNHDWTTDRAFAARGWTELEPDRADEVMRLLAWADGSLVAAADQLTAALKPDGIVAAISERFAAEIGLWPDAPRDSPPRSSS